MGVLGETMVSMESVAPVRFIWVRYQPELTLPVPSRAHFRVFRPDFGLSEACILPSEQPHCVLATQNVAWPHKIWLGHTESGLATLWPGHSVPLWESHSQGVRAGGWVGGARVKSEGSPRQSEGSPRHTHSRTQERFPAAAGGQM